MRNRLGLVALLVALLPAHNAVALDSFNLSNLSGLQDDTVSTMLRTVAIGADHRAQIPATPSGIIGFDVGIGLTAISVPTDFATAFSLATGTASTSVPGTIAVPRVNIHKGLPGNIDLGFSFASSKLVGQAEDLFSLWGFDASWAALSGMGPLPAVSFRFSMSGTDLWFLDTKTYAIDAIVSKNLFLIDPYVGAGLKIWSGDLQIPVELQGQTVTFTGNQSGTNPHLFVGLPIKLAILRMTFDLDYSLSGLTTYGAKVSIGF